MPFFSDFFAAHCEQIEKDFYRRREVAERNQALIERRRQDEAALTKAVTNELAALDKGRHRHIKRHRVALNEEHCCYANEFTEWLRLMEEARCRHAASLQATVSATISCADEQRRHAAAAQTAESAELALAEERRQHDAAAQMAMCAASSLADEHHHHEAAAQAAESAVLPLAEERRQHTATELATMSAVRSLVAS